MARTSIQPPSRSCSLSSRTANTSFQRRRPSIHRCLSLLGAFSLRAVRAHLTRTNISQTAITSKVTKAGSPFGSFGPTIPKSTTLPGTNLGGATAPGFPTDQTTGFRNISFSHNYAFSPTLFNEVDFGFHITHVNLAQKEAFNYSDVGISAPSFDNTIPAIEYHWRVDAGWKRADHNTRSGRLHSARHTFLLDGTPLAPVWRWVHAIPKRHPRLQLPCGHAFP